VPTGLVASLNRPGGNVTGVTSITAELVGKSLGLLHELLPEAGRFAVLVNPNLPSANSTITDAQAAAATLGRQIVVLPASTNREIDAAFASLVEKRVAGLVVTGALFFDSRRVQLITLAAHHGVPVIYPLREYGPIPPSRRLCRPYPQGGKAGQPPSAAAHQVRTGH
jgi:putative ABC transport system substrate-binding protein